MKKKNEKKEHILSLETGVKIRRKSPKNNEKKKSTRALNSLEFIPPDSSTSPFDVDFEEEEEEEERKEEEGEGEEEEEEEEDDDELCGEEEEVLGAKKRETDFPERATALDLSISFPVFFLSIKIHNQKENKRE